MKINNPRHEKSRRGERKIILFLKYKRQKYTFLEIAKSAVDSVNS